LNRISLSKVKKTSLKLMKNISRNLLIKRFFCLCFILMMLNNQQQQEQQNNNKNSLSYSLTVVIPLFVDCCV